MAFSCGSIASQVYSDYDLHTSAIKLVHVTSPNPHVPHMSLNLHCRVFLALSCCSVCDFATFFKLSREKWQGTFIEVGGVGRDSERKGGREGGGEGEGTGGREVGLEGCVDFLHVHVCTCTVVCTHVLYKKWGSLRLLPLLLSGTGCQLIHKCMRSW